MLAFKTADLEVQQENFYAYIAAPTHHLKSISASAVNFLDHTMQTLSPAQPTDALYAGASQDDAVLNGLCFELDTYLHEPVMRHSRITGTQHEWFDPLRYWTVCIFPCFYVHFSIIHIECRKEVPIPLSACNGYPSSTSIRSCL